MSLVGKYLVIKYDEGILEKAYLCIDQDSEKVSISLDNGSTRNYWNSSALVAFEKPEDAKLLINMQKQLIETKKKNREQERKMAEAIHSIAENYNIGKLV